MKELNDKNKEFCEEYVKNGYNWTKAYAKVYSQDNENGAAVGASQLLKQQRIRDYIDVVEWSFKLIGQRGWIDKSIIVGVLQKMITATKHDIKWNDVPDWTARANGINIYAKLAWFDKEKESKDMWDDKKSWEVNIEEMTEEEKKIYRENLLKSL